MKTIDISSIRINGGTQSRAAFPITTEDIRSSSWAGVCNARGRGIITTITRSFFDEERFIVRVCGDTCSQNIEPVPADQVFDYVRIFLERFGGRIGHARWKKSDEKPLDMPSYVAGKGGAIVYFLKAGPFIKIGKATHNAARRVDQLQTGCPYPIEVIGEIPGSYVFETLLHKKFDHLRAHGEWFHSTPELRQFITLMLEGAAQ